MRICFQCKIEKPLSEFYGEVSRKEGKSYICKPCRLKRSREWYEANKAYVLERRRKLREAGR